MSEVTPEARAQAVEALFEKWFDTGARASWCPKMLDEFTAFIQAAVEEERERCATVAESMRAYCENGEKRRLVASIAQAIRQQAQAGREGREERETNP